MRTEQTAAEQIQALIQKDEDAQRECQAEMKQLEKRYGRKRIINQDKVGLSIFWQHRNLRQQSNDLGMRIAGLRQALAIVQRA